MLRSDRALEPGCGFPETEEYISSVTLLVHIAGIKAGGPVFRLHQVFPRYTSMNADILIEQIQNTARLVQGGATALAAQTNNQGQYRGLTAVDDLWMLLRSDTGDARLRFKAMWSSRVCAFFFVNTSHEVNILERVVSCLSKVFLVGRLF